MNKPTKIDLHMHTTVSDGTDRPEEILVKVMETGIDLFSVTDHDAIAGCGVIHDILKSGDEKYPRFISGVEFNSQDEEGKYHILGYCYDSTAPSIVGLVEKAHAMRQDKVNRRFDFLKEEFGFEFSEEDVAELKARDNPGKPHFANLMVKYGYAPDKDTAISDYINKRSFKELHVEPGEAIAAILEADGIPILAHPAYGSGDELIIGEDMEKRLARLMDMGIAGLEAFYSGFTDKIRAQMLNLAEKHHLYVTAGSDYHGKNKLVTMGDTNMKSMDEAPASMLRFLEAIGI